MQAQNNRKLEKKQSELQAKQKVKVHFERAGQFYLVYNGFNMIKVHHGASEEKVNELLGCNYELEKTAINTDQKRIYRFNGSGLKRLTYKLLLRNGILEWIMKAAQ